MAAENPWTLDDGIALVRALQQDARKFGYHVCIGGGVVNKGSSEKDVDIYFLSMCQNRKNDSDDKGLLQWLEDMWGTPRNIGKEYEQKSAMNHLPEVIRVADANQPRGFRYEYKLPKPPRFEKPVEEKQEGKPSPYTHKLIFSRASGDRIDVFVLG